MSEEFPKELSINDKHYVHGPVIPEEQRKIPEKCAYCAGSKAGMGCTAFGYECLYSADVYWILRPKLDRPREKLADIPTAERATCPHCRRKYRAANGVVVETAAARERWCPWCAVEHTSECQKCGAKCAEGYGDSLDGAHWCGRCVTEHTKVCGSCGKRVPAAGLTAVETGSVTEHWCPACVSSKSTACGHCGKQVAITYTVTVDGAAWCKECADVHAGRCSSCGHLSADLQSIEEGGDERLCPPCLERATRATVYGYHGFPLRDRPKFWATEAEAASPAPLLYLGFELEAGGATSSGKAGAAAAVHRIDPTEVRFHLEQDSSIPDHGFELISSPHTLAAHAAYRWNDVVKAMTVHGMKSHDLNGACGLHVHVSRDFLTSADCTCVDLFVLKNRKFWERVSRRSQSGMAAYKDKARLSEFGRSGERHVAVNFTNVNTVEFRMFRGTLKYGTLMATLEIVDGLCRWIKTRTTDDMLANDKETERFAAWLAAGGDRYARAVKYIEERKAVDDPNGASASTGD